MAVQLDKELQEFRDLIEVPSKFEEGFSWASFAGALFVGLLMVPGSMYMSLVTGMGLGNAAQWVTVILFLEVVRRTHKSLKRAEIFVLFYMTAAAVGSPFGDLIYRQFIVQSDAVASQGWQGMFPIWYAPTDPEVLSNRTFFTRDWLPAVGMIVFFNVLSRLDTTILGFGLFKIASDYEKLPFPMAPVGAMGVVALAEEDDEASWKWRAFSIGGAIGMIFGFVYMGVPILSNAVFGITMQPLPIPFVDWTGKTENILPAVATGLSFDMGSFLIGMVLPWWAVVGAFIGLIITFIANPTLYHFGILTQWRPGDGTIITLFKNTVDFYFSFGVGLSLAIAIVGIYSVVQSVRRSKAAKQSREEAFGAPPGRGDIPNWLIIYIYVQFVTIYVLLSGWLIDWHRGVMLVMVFYALIYTPIISYVTARLEGMAGQVINLPLVREAGFILSGYQGLKIWFLPIPVSNYGVATVSYRQAELTGTRFWSIWKAEALLVPFILICSIFFAQFIWSLAPVPSAAYPYAERIWELNAMNQTLLWSSTMGEFSQFQKAFSVVYLGAGVVLGLAGYITLAVFGAPVLLSYGFVRGLGQTMPHTILPEFIGACLGQFWLRKKFGNMWRKYITTVTAGFGCGAGLVGMFCVGVTFLSKAVFQLSY